MNLEIVITYKWMHPHYGGERTEHRRFKMSEGEKAEKCYLDFIDKVGDYEHCFIEVVETI